MNGKRAKRLRKASGFSVKAWRTSDPKDKYQIKKVVKDTREIEKFNFKTLEKEIKEQKLVAVTLLCRGAKVLYKSWKAQYYQRRFLERV